MNIQQIRDVVIAPVVQTYDVRDTILYALGLGYGRDPMDEVELPFVYEKALRCVPSFANVLAHPGLWEKQPRFDVDWTRILHGEQRTIWHAPLPVSGSVRAECRVTAVEDKGPGRGAVLHQERDLFDEANGAHLATLRWTHFLRSDGGHGGFGTPSPLTIPVPDRPADRVVELATRADQAILYRLSGDWHVLHIDPEFARDAGFDRPILHGLCAKGIACRALLATYCGNDVARLKDMAVRFSAPVIPGETMHFEFIEGAGGMVHFRATSAERGAVLLDRGSAGIA